MPPWEKYGAPEAPAGPWQRYAVPAAEPPAQGDTMTGYARDIAKQIPSGLVTGVESIAAFPARAAGALGSLAEQYIPGMAPSPEQAADRAKLQELIKANRGEGIADYLPKPQTTPGQYARTASEFIPSMVAATPAKLALPRAAGAGVTAGLASEAAGQATEGTPYEPYARAAGALVGGAGALRQTERAAAQRAVPSAEAIRDAASAGYDRARNLGVEIKPQAAEDLATRLKSSLTESGLDGNVAPKTWGILGKLEGPTEPIMTVQNFQSLRKTLGNAAGSADRSERLAAVQAKQELDGWLANLPPDATIAGNPKQAAALLREANKNYAAAERADELSRKVMRAALRAEASNSGMNLGNNVRARMADILDSPKLRRGFQPDEVAAMRKIVKGSPVENALRWGGNVLGGGGGLGQLATGAAAVGGAYALDDPKILGLPFAGGLAKWASNRMTAANAARLNAMVRARAPLAGAGPRVASPASRLGLLSPQMPGPGPQASEPQFAGAREYTYAPGEIEDNQAASFNGVQGYPDFHWVNPAGVDAFLARAPLSKNIDDRRGEHSDAEAARLRRRLLMD